jgi:cell division protein FtsW (lipid II flippase)
LFTPATSFPDKLQNRLFYLAALFLGLNALAITLAPAARSRTWQVDYPWTHWIGYLVWLVMFNIIHRRSVRDLPDRDPYLLPIAALLSGWGMLMISRLSPSFGLRQCAWLLVSTIVLILGLRLPADLGFLRRYKYLWLTSGLVLTALTLAFGTNPMGQGPRLWLGCCGVYFQPSEPLKLLLIIYLSAYLSDHQVSFLTLSAGSARLGKNRFTSLLPLLAPTLLMTGLAVLLLVIQKDLGTASVFIFLYAAIVYMASGLASVLWISLFTLILTGGIGYLLFDVVRLRIDAWLNPWADPSGRSYQIVQSLLAVGNGGLLGRGPGMGNPGLVPIPHSDFIFVSIAEEAGLIGTLALISFLAFFLGRGISVALRASSPFHRLLAGGLTAYIAGQSILIIGGNLRLLPLTGVTLPFISYGGSSLITSYISLFLLLRISGQSEHQPASQPHPLPFVHIGLALLAGLAATAILAGWWAIIRGPALLTRTDNARRSIADRYVLRGSLFDRNDIPLAETTGEPGNYIRQIRVPDLGPIIGYTHPVYGQSGIEASLDPYLRGTRGNPQLLIWWEHLLYGQPPPGADIRLSLDLSLQRQADSLLASHPGAVVLLDAKSGEILVMASHPTFDPNLLDQSWKELIQDPHSPLLNRTTQGLYPTGTALGPLLLAKANEQGTLPSLPQILSYPPVDQAWKCSKLQFSTSSPAEWSSMIASGCPGPVAALGNLLGSQKMVSLFKSLGFFDTPSIDLPAAASTLPDKQTSPEWTALGVFDPNPESLQILRLSPLQIALANATLSNQGMRPAPRLVMAVNTTQAGWVILPGQAEPEQIFSPEVASRTTTMLADATLPIWFNIASSPPGINATHPEVTWFNGGTTSAWLGSPLAIAVVLEDPDPDLAYQIGMQLLEQALQP